MGVYFYEVELYWKSDHKGLLTSHGLEGIEVVSPLEILGMKTNNWTPDQLLAGYLSSCYMATFLGHAANMKLNISSYQSQCFVKMEILKGKYVTKEILLRPMISLADDSLLLKAYKCIEDAEGSCVAIDLIKVEIEVHPQFEYLNSEAKSNAKAS